ncbi:MAG: diacylglycerol kinase family protein [Lachnospiraceae bacterium]|nr:diacylglycerol kinase family protein [Lachnospiraceae bacterium]
MAEYEVLYNSLSGNGRGKERAKEAEKLLNSNNTELLDVTKIENKKAWFEGITPGTKVVLVGGDGTLSRFADSLRDTKIENEIYLYPSGTGDDFKADVAKDETGLIKINDYLNNLPLVTVNGKTYSFINGVGYGIDGYCCEVGDEKRAKSDKPVNYAGIAIKGLLFHFKPVNARVTVDGKEYTFKKVWLAPTMKGRHYGGGMIPTPAQDRFDPEGRVSLMLFHGSGKLKTLMIFPSIFKGGHISHKDCVTVMKGKNIEVEFDRPTALQIDGETIKNVKKYSVCA